MFFPFVFVLITNSTLPRTSDVASMNFMFTCLILLFCGTRCLSVNFHHSFDFHCFAYDVSLMTKPNHDDVVQKHFSRYSIRMSNKTQRTNIEKKSQTITSPWKLMQSSLLYFISLFFHRGSVDI